MGWCGIFWIVLDDDSLRRCLMQDADAAAGPQRSSCRLLPNWGGRGARGAYHGEVRPRAWHLPWGALRTRTLTSLMQAWLLLTVLL